jgi:hypothetical protein
MVPVGVGDAGAMVALIATAAPCMTVSGSTEILVVLATAALDIVTSTGAEIDAL